MKFSAYQKRLHCSFWTTSTFRWTVARLRGRSSLWRLEFSRAIWKSKGCCFGPSPNETDFCRRRKCPLFREANESALGSLFQAAGYIQNGQLAVLVIDVFFPVITEAGAA